MEKVGWLVDYMIVSSSRRDERDQEYCGIETLLHLLSLHQIQSLSRLWTCEKRFWGVMRSEGAWFVCVFISRATPTRREISIWVQRSTHFYYYYWPFPLKFLVFLKFYFINFLLTIITVFFKFLWRVIIEKRDWEIQFPTQNNIQEST